MTVEFGHVIGFGNCIAVGVVFGVGVCLSIYTYTNDIANLSF